MNTTMQELLDSKPATVREYPVVAKYTVNGQVIQIPPWSHPSTIANRILNEIQHTYYYGVQIIAPPGNGKTTIAKVIAHHLHTKAYKEMGLDFDVRLSVERDTHAFENLNYTIKRLAKRPTIMIFDDLSGVFGKMSEEQIDRNFETLTQVRWILDEAEGKIPFIPILTYHYSKIIEKKFRSQNGISIFCRFGNEEKSNIDTIAPKKTQARRAVLNFRRILKTMFTKHYFELMFENGHVEKYETDNPLRACLMVSDDVGNIIVSSKYDVCEKCDTTSTKRKIDEEQAVRELYSRLGRHGIQQLRQSLANRGIKGAIHPLSEHALHFIESRFLPAYDFDLEKLRDAVYKMYKLGMPRKRNRKAKEEKAILDYLDSIAYEPEQEKSA